MWGAYWVPFLIAAILIALLVAAAAQPSHRWTGTRRVGERPVPPAGAAPTAEDERVAEREEAEAAAALGCGIFFWVLAVVAIIAIIAGYAWNWPVAP